MAGKNGGARPGAGRPKGSISRPQLRDYFSPKDVEQLAAELRERAKTDSTILKFLGEQIFGKASQGIDLTSGGERVTVAAFNFVRHEDDHTDNSANS